MSIATDILQAAQRLPFGFTATSGVGIPFGFWIFPINPEDYSVSMPTKGNVVQTIGGNYEDWFGLGIGTGSIRGTFGFKPRVMSGDVPIVSGPAVLLPGQAQFKALEALFKSFYSFTIEQARRNNIALNFFSLSDLHYFRVRVTNFQFDRSVRHQFLYRYDIRFDILEDYLQRATNVIGAVGALGGGLLTAAGGATLGGIANNLTGLAGGGVADPLIAESSGLRTPSAEPPAAPQFNSGLDMQ